MLFFFAWLIKGEGDFKDLDEAFIVFRWVCNLGFVLFSDVM